MAKRQNVAQSDPHDIIEDAVETSTTLATQVVEAMKQHQWNDATDLARRLLWQTERATLAYNRIIDGE